MRHGTSHETHESRLSHESRLTTRVTSHDSRVESRVTSDQSRFSITGSTHNQCQPHQLLGRYWFKLQTATHRTLVAFSLLGTWFELYTQLGRSCTARAFAASELSAAAAALQLRNAPASSFQDTNSLYMSCAIFFFKCQPNERDHPHHPNLHLQPSSVPTSPPLRLPFTSQTSSATSGSSRALLRCTMRHSIKIKTQI